MRRSLLASVAVLTLAFTGCERFRERRHILFPRLHGWIAAQVIHRMMPSRREVEAYLKAQAWAIVGMKP